MTENRNRQTRLNSRRAYYQRHKERLNAEMRAKRAMKEVVVEDKTEFVLSYMDMTRSQLEDCLKREKNPVLIRVIKGFIRELEC
jgi:hypothetical protein